ncbi:MAG TPA: UDP-2,3-diacylglucosamine diphosphatase LpxI [Caulobacteraceae bacterium]|nr:UDP-2,3-diacylglucosamine diphosphatase LpxI [Caulobacteraceae bacterium]
MVKLGLIAGGGALPVSLAAHCRAVGRPLFVLRLKGFAGPDLQAFDGVDVGLAELGKGIDALRRAVCGAICLAGVVDRPDLASLKPDLRGLKALPGAIGAARKGDDALLSFLVAEFEAEGFAVEGAHEVMRGLTLGEGPLGRHEPGPAHLADVGRALEAARAVGRLDIGQGAVACEGLVLAVEAQEGTDAMLRRVATLPLAIRGTPQRPRGVLAKASKPGQELRVDLPTVGPETVRRAAEAGLAGIAGEAGQILLLDRDETRRLADEAGLFVLGVPPA